MEIEKRMIDGFVTGRRQLTDQPPKCTKMPSKLKRQSLGIIKQTANSSLAIVSAIGECGDSGVRTWGHLS